MRIVLLISLVVLPAYATAQTPTPPPPQTAPAKPRPPAQTTSRTALVVTVTDPTGATLPGIQVDVLGAADRTGETDASGQLRFGNMRAGTYRLRFSGPKVIPFEREMVVRAGQIADLDVTLNPAPEPPPQAPPPPQPVAGAPVGPPGEPNVTSILDLLEKEFVGRQPRKETPLGCNGNTRSTMIQLNEPLPERLYDNAEAVYYVLGGEGTISLEGRDSPIVTGSLAMVPRGTSHAFVRKGRRPLILLAVLSGEPCSSTP